MILAICHWCARRIVDAASLLIPGLERDAFREEWQGELWYEALGGGADSGRLLRRAAGAFRDALSIRRLNPHDRERRNSMLAQDIRFALRSFRRRPLWAGVIVMTLAVVIGANTAIFSLVNAVLIQPLAFPEPDRLVKVNGSNREEGNLQNLSPADFYDLAAESDTIESMGAHGWVGFFTITGDGNPERLGGTQVTAGFFRTLGVRPALGRLFTEHDDVDGAPLTTVLTHAFWQRRFGGRPGVIGETVLVNARPHEIVGVLPATYAHPEPNPEREPALYTLYQFDRASLCRDCRFIRAVGRLREGRALEQASAEVEAIAARLEETYPDSNTNRGVTLTPLKEAIVGDARSGLLVLLGAVGAVLLIACVNLANLQLAEGASRRHTFAIQAALGAGRRRVVRTLVTESFLLSLLGGALGLAVAYALRGFIAVRAIPRATDLSFDFWVLGFCLALAAVTALVFGFLPALSLSRGNLGGLVAEGGVRGSSARWGSRRVLIAAEIAISLVLLVAAGLFVKSLSELRGVAPGFETERVLTMSVSLPTARYEEGEQIPFYDQLYERLGALPGVDAVGATNILPLTNNYSRDGFQIDERPAPRGENPSAEARSVSASYFETMGIPLLRGRLFDERERKGSPGVIVVSEAFAETFFPDEDPLGERITYNRGVPDDLRLEIGGPGSREIIGIVGDVKHLELENAEVPMFYTPQPHDPSFHTMTLVVRTALEPEEVARSVRGEIARMDPEIPLYAVRALDDVLDDAVATPRFRATIVGLFAVVALGLAVVGVYSIMGLLVSQREQEIGIRMALGAKAKDVVRMLIGENMKPVVFGIALGAVAAVGLGRFLASLLFRVAATDPVVFVAVAALLGVAALAATVVPSLRASRIDPIQTLRAD